MKPERPRPTPPRPEPAPQPAIRSFYVEALSRGKGVPREARDALTAVQRAVRADEERGVSVRIHDIKKIGFEGDSRLCVDYSDARDGTRAWERAQAIVKGIELVNLIAEPCEKSGEEP
jgi:hypothetical protein